MKSARLIQTQWRGWAARQRLAHTRKLNTTALLVQTRWRAVQARRHLAALRHARHTRLSKCATRIQATWRGYVARKRYNEQQQKRMQQLRQQQQQQQQSRRSNFVTQSSTASSSTDSSTRTLGARIQNSLKILNCPDVSIPLTHIISSLNDLHTVTRLSPECCEIFVNESATDILFGFIANCNRSVPHMDMIKLCLDILLNLARYARTVDQVTTHPASFPTLVNLLQAYQLSNPAIFMNVCVIMLLMNRHGCLTDVQMSQVGGREKFAAKLVGMHMTLEKRRTSTRVTDTAAASAAQQRAQRRYVYALEPDWQLGRMSSRTIEFTDALNALETLIGELGMRHVLTVSSSAVVSTSTSKRVAAPRRDAQTPTAAHSSTQHMSTRASARRIEYSTASVSNTAVDTIVEHSTTIISNDNNSSVLSNITIRSVTGFNEEPHLNSTRNHL